jgi:hypothetical protein
MISTAESPMIKTQLPNTRIIDTPTALRNVYSPTRRKMNTNSL